MKILSKHEMGTVHLFPGDEIEASVNPKDGSAVTVKRKIDKKINVNRISFFEGEIQGIKGIGAIFGEEK